VDLARLFEPKAQARARVSEALRQRFQPLKAPRRSTVPPPLLSPRRIFNHGRQQKPVPDENLCAYRSIHLGALAHAPSHYDQVFPTSMGLASPWSEWGLAECLPHRERDLHASDPRRTPSRTGSAARWGQVSPTRRRLALEGGPRPR
jgi:hypothetical protein